MCSFFWNSNPSDVPGSPLAGSTAVPTPAGGTTIPLTDMSPRGTAGPEPLTEQQVAAFAARLPDSPSHTPTAVSLNSPEGTTRPLPANVDASPPTTGANPWHSTQAPPRWYNPFSPRPSDTSLPAETVTAPVTQTPIEAPLPGSNSDNPFVRNWARLPEENPETLTRFRSKNK